MPKAFVYMEIDTSKNSAGKGQPMYTLHYNGNHIKGCSKMQSPDENFFIQELRDIRKKNGITLLSKLPPQIERTEGTIIREPYDLFFLLKASAGNNSNK